MTGTVADLLKKVEHKIPADCPVLSTPLSEFDKDEYPAIVTILWLYGEGWIQPALVSDAGPKLGTVSAEQVGKFYKDVTSKVTKAISISDLNEAFSENTPAVNIECNHPNVWITPAQITSWLSDIQLFHDLFPHKEPMQNRTTQTSSLTNEAFDAHGDELIFKRHYATDKYQTLQALYGILGIRLPENMSPDLVFILNQNVKGLMLTDEQLAELMYYTLLFVYGFASIDTSLFNCTYVDSQTVKNLNRIAQIRSDILRTKLDLHQIYVENFDSLLGNELKLNQCDLHSNLLALICFENFPLLKKLYLHSWQKQNLDAEKIIQAPSIALFPAKNHFMLGRILCFQKGGITLVNESVHDLTLLVNLMSVAAEAKSQATPFFSSTEHSPSASQYKTQFDQLKGQIKNPIVRQSINPEQLNSYTLSLVINHQAIVEFLLIYGIQADAMNSPSDEMLQDFLMIFNLDNKQTITATIDNLAKRKQLINLDDADDLTNQIESAKRKIELLDQKLTQTSESSKLTHDWYHAQKTIWSRFEFLLNEKVTAQIQTYISVK